MRGLAGPSLRPQGHLKLERLAKGAPDQAGIAGPAWPLGESCRRAELCGDCGCCKEVLHQCKMGGLARQRRLVRKMQLYLRDTDGSRGSRLWGAVMRRCRVGLQQDNTCCHARQAGGAEGRCGIEVSK